MSRVSTSRSTRVILTLRGMSTSAGGEVRLTRLIGNTALPAFDPFVFDGFAADKHENHLADFPGHLQREGRDCDLHARKCQSQPLGVCVASSYPWMNRPVPQLVPVDGVTVKVITGKAGMRRVRPCSLRPSRWTWTSAWRLMLAGTISCWRGATHFRGPSPAWGG